MNIQSPSLNLVNPAYIFGCISQDSDNAPPEAQKSKQLICWLLADLFV